MREKLTKESSKYYRIVIKTEEILLCEMNLQIKNSD